jgi:hypothetical protein
MEVANRRLLALQEFMRKYVAQYGQQGAKGAKAALTLKVTLAFEGRNEDDFTIKADMREAVPSRPATLSRAMALDDEAGRPLLFVKKSGSEAAPVQQGKLVTNAGEKINPDTGEVVTPGTDGAESI